MNPNQIFILEDDGGPSVIVRNVPIFRTHTDRDYVCDEEWLDRCVADFLTQKAESSRFGAKYAMLPSLTVGHTPTDPDAPEPPAVGFIDNLRRDGEFLYCDFVGVPRNLADQMRESKWPYRSAEVAPKKHRLTNVSLLGGRYPHFALPVMRFKSEDGTEIVRYTMVTKPKNDEIDRHQMPGGGGMDIQQLAQAVAPMVAEILASKQAMMAGGAGAAYSLGGVQRHEEESDAGKHTSNTADAAEDDDYQTKQDEESADFGGEEQGSEKEDFKGEKKDDDSMKMSDPAAEKYVKTLRAENRQMKEQLQKQATAINNLQRHNASQAQASKRTMLRAKCRELAALGYALGDSEKIEKHVERMMPMDVSGVKDYVEGVLKQFPKVAESVRRHVSHDNIRRPGAPLTDNEQYVAEDPERMEQMGLDRHVLDLADVLAGDVD